MTNMERIYTIPVNEAFEASAADPSLGCPFCALYSKLQSDELDLILGASMMEPDVRIKTNEAGFCPDHFDMLFVRGKRLPLALMLESHLDVVRKKLKPGALSGLFASKSAADAVKKVSEINGRLFCGRKTASSAKRRRRSPISACRTTSAFSRRQKNGSERDSRSSIPWCRKSKTGISSLCRRTCPPSAAASITATPKNP